MTEVATPTPFDKQCLEALKAVGKTLGQMNLYRVGHPAVTATMQEALRILTQILTDAPNQEAAFVLDHDKLVANGRIVGTLAQVPNAIVQFYNRYRLNSIVFKAGLTEAELTALCEMAGLRAEQAKELKVEEYLAQRGISHIGLNEAIYAKVARAPESGVVEVPTWDAGGGQPAEAAPLSTSPAPHITPAVLEQYPIEKSLEELVRIAVPDPKDQEAVYSVVMRQLQAEIENKVQKATQGLRREKTTLENEQTRTQTVLTGMAEGVVVVDDHGKVLMMNPAAEELYGAKLSELAGKSLAEGAGEGHLLTLSQEIVTPQDRAVNPEVHIKATEDTKRTLRSSTAVVQNEAGKPVGMISVLSDVTKHKEMEKMEREFVAHVTHELRAPLSSIRAALEILQAQTSDKIKEEENKIFDTALRNADRLEDLIRGILDFSKIEAGQMTVHPKPIEAERIAREGAESLRPWCIKKGIQLTLRVDSNLPLVSADHGRSVQVMVNLLSNAIKFTPSGGSIDVRAARGGSGYERFVLYSVSDTGPGIAKKDQAKVFEKFVQIAAGEKSIGGTGLGLSIAKALIHLQNGQMWLESDAGQGARFYFTLPIYTAPRETTEAPQPPPPPKPWWKRLFGG